MADASGQAVEIRIESDGEDKIEIKGDYETVPLKKINFNKNYYSKAIKKS